ncbi:MAG: ATP-binding protein, partial [Rubrobacteridae bacterium]|nr:ATP-binding protein [Rubrobacteridae bacterium]
PDSKALSFDERISLLVDMEETSRNNRRLGRLLKSARLRENAAVENIDFRVHRRKGLDRSMIISLGNCSFVEKRHNILITGPTGIGKTFIACALGNAACRHGHSSLCYRFPRLLSELKLAHADGSYVKLLDRLAKISVLVIDDWGINALSEMERKDFLEIIEDRYKLRSTIIVSQIPVKNWHDIVGNPTIADAILDRLVHNAYKIDLDGPSMRKNNQDLT